MFSFQYILISLASLTVVELKRISSLITFHLPLVQLEHFDCRHLNQIESLYLQVVKSKNFFHPIFYFNFLRIYILTLCNKTLPLIYLKLLLSSPFHIHYIQPKEKQALYLELAFIILSISTFLPEPLAVTR